ncbi:MAG: HYR domain-containing protein, partial [Verrucomicrobia bacterium]|nr:HYR domain-containing protein [Verrucomicrobiota bacterium]
MKRTVLITLSAGFVLGSFGADLPEAPVELGEPAAITVEAPPENVISLAPNNQPQASTIPGQFEGMFQTSSIRPPDPHGAAGPSGIIQTVNLRVAYYDRTGAAIWGPLSFVSFFTSVGTASGISDPRAIYDVGSGRFYVILQDSTSTLGFFNVAVSKTSNPVSGTTADWFFYRFDVTQTVGSTKYGPDYPGLGVDSQALYLTANMFSLPFATAGAFLDTQIIVLDKAALNSGAAVTPKRIFPSAASNAFTLQPATVLGGNNPGNVAYFAEVPFSTTIAVRIWALNNPLGASPTLTSANVTVPNNGGAPANNAPQKGTTITIDTLSPRTQGNAFWHNGSLWFCHTAGGSSGKAIVYYYRINSNGYPNNAPTLAESGGIDGGAGEWTYQPAIGGNANGDVCIVYTQSSANRFPTITYTSRNAGASSFDPATFVKVSANFSNSDRWGDYASVSADPTDNSFWITHEWAKSSALHNWSTWWAHVVLSSSGNPLAISCPSNISVPAAAGTCVSNVVFSVPTTSGGTGTVTVVCNPPSGSSFPVGTTTVNCTATDSVGATAACSFTVTVIDTQPPVINCPAPIVVNASAGACASNVVFSVSAVDNCGVASVVSVPPSGFAFPVGTTRVTSTATDVNGNVATCTFTVTVNDTQPPIIYCYSDVTLTLPPGQCSSNFIYYITAFDNCAVVSTNQLAGLPSGAAFPVGVTTNVFVCTDVGGYTSSCSFTVTVIGSCNPVLTVASSNPNSGVSVTVSPNDNNGQGNGVTQFTRTYNLSTVVNLTAPAIAGGNNFVKWQRDGADWATTVATSVTMDVSHTMTAIYAAPIDAGLVGYWKLDDGSGLSAVDSSGNGNTGTLLNGPTWTSGQFGGGLSLDGVNDYVSVNNAPSLNPSSQITLSAWIRPSNLSVSGEIISKENNSLTPAQNQYFLRLQAGGKIRFTVAGV